MKNIFSLVILSLFLSACGESQNSSDEARLKKGSLIARTGKTWPNKSIIIVTFNDGTPEIKAEVERFSKEWTKFANVNFVFYSTPKQLPKNKAADIIITFNTKVNTSAIGTDSKIASVTESSMNLSILSNKFIHQRRGLILHEFGHALGLEHEHQHKDRTLAFDETKAIGLCRSQLGFDEPACKMFILETFKDKDIYFSKYDPFSIMHYTLHPDFYKSKVDMDENMSLSLTDKLEISRLYPGRVSTEEIILGHENQIRELKALNTYKNCKLVEYKKEKIRPTEKGAALTTITELSIVSIAPNEFMDNYVWEDKESTVLYMQSLDYCNLSEDELAAVRLKKMEEQFKTRSFGQCTIPVNEDGTVKSAGCDADYPYQILNKKNKSVDNNCYQSFDQAQQEMKSLAQCKMTP